MLGQLVGRAEDRARALEVRRSALERAAADVAPPPDFAAALRRDTVAVIAEVKRRSPSKGDIRPDLSAVEQVTAYAAGGAAAISVLTEPERFGGSGDDLAAARGVVAIPLLKKDFHVAELQIVEARALGAAAALVIARAVPPARVSALVREAHVLGIDALVEVRDERELDSALESGARVIGVNNRNLETLAIDLRLGEHLIPRIPADRVAVFESGVTGEGDVRRAAEAGADAVLVGSALCVAPDAAAAVRALADVRRVGRGTTPMSR